LASSTGSLDVDAKQNERGVFVTEVNDNPNVEAGAEDGCLQSETIISNFGSSPSNYFILQPSGLDLYFASRASCLRIVLDRQVYQEIER